MNSDVNRASGQVERDIEQAITALKKGACLLKYGRRGKPKFCPFRLANDESTLIWFSDKDEKHLKLSHVSRIISGQRTPIFQRHPRPEKEYQSFSLIYNDRSLDLICKDKDEAEVWFSGLKALISRSRQRKWRTESRSDGIPSGATSPRTYTRGCSPLHSPLGSGDSLQEDGGDQLRLHSPYGSPHKNGVSKAFSNVNLYSASASLHPLPSGGSDGIHSQMKPMGVDNFRVSLSSAVSSSSHGSGHDDGDALGDVFIWGEGTGEGVIGGGPHRVGICNSSIKLDSLFPKPLESAVVLDVQTIACSGKYAALVTKQGEVFTWGEESGGRLGHGVDSDVPHPKLIDTLNHTNIELVACGENHSCAVTLSGELYTWGAGDFGLLGHGNEVSHWVPKRVNRPLEGIHVSYISCGLWHTAVVTSAGQLFTFGDGTFGVLGHGDRRSITKPREVESLKGLRTVRAACGVWHTAAVVEIIVGNSSSSNCSSGKIFTWGDGDNGRLGHGDKESKLVPTCVAALVEPNFYRVDCGHSFTVALTTSGHVYTMGSPVYGQLGHPQADGKVPCRVEGKLLKTFVEEISCGAYHVAVLTSRTEVYTWGKGANGRLGHGDTDNRNYPTLVEALKNKQVKSIACGTNFTAAICLHKGVSGVDQSMCSGCRLPFNFKRKRHNCYNCGLAFCHSCSSKKSLRASMAPSPSKPYRVCDNCCNKLKKASQTNDVITDKDTKLSRAHLARFSSMESFKQVENRSSKQKKRFEFNSSRVSPIPSQLGASAPNVPRSSNPMFGSSKKFFSASVPGSRIVSRATSPTTSRRSSPPRSTTPTPTLGGLTSPRIAVDNAKRNKESLTQEVVQLRAQVEALTRKAQLQEIEVERSNKQLKEALAIAGEETAKCKAAKEVIKSLTAQLKEMAERLPVGPTWNIKSPKSASSESNSDILNGCIDKVQNQLTYQELESTNGSNRTDAKNRQGNPEATTRNGGRKKEGDSRKENEWVEQDEPGVYITLTSLPGGVKDLKRVRFSRKRFSEKQAEQWWAENSARVYERYNIRLLDMPSTGTRSMNLRQFWTSVYERYNICIKSPKPASSESNSDILNGCIDKVQSQLTYQELESTNAGNRTDAKNRQGNPEATTRNGGRTKEGDSRNENEWVEQDEPGVYITLTSLPGGVKDLKRVRFSRKRFSEKQAEQWWAENSSRVYERYNIRLLDKPSTGTRSVNLGH